MRWLVSVGVAVSCSILPACALYFGPADDAPGPDDPYPDEPGSGSDPMDPDWMPPPPQYTFARCEDGKRFVTTGPLPAHDMPGHGAGTPAGQCAGACRSAIAECAGTDCTTALAHVCGAPVATGASSVTQGAACTGSGSVTYTHTTKCGQVVPGGTCTCNGTQYECTSATNSAGIHASLVGKWRGTVDSPFGAGFPVSVWIYPDGTYWAECTTTAYCNPFYYGGSGPHPWRRIQVLATSETLGAWADIGQFYSFNVGSLSSLFVTPTTLTFTYHAAWHNCAKPFQYNLTRE